MQRLRAANDMDAKDQARKSKKKKKSTTPAKPTHYKPTFEVEKELDEATEGEEEEEENPPFEVEAPDEEEGAQPAE